MTKYSVTLIYDATESMEVNADSPEEAASQAQDRAEAGLCHQCNNHLELGDVITVRVHDDTGMNLLHEDGYHTLASPRAGAVVPEGSVVSFVGFIGLSEFSDGSLYAELTDVKGHPRLGDTPYVRTSSIKAVFYDGGRIQRIVTMNNTYERAAAPEVPHE